MTFLMALMTIQIMGKWVTWVTEKELHQNMGSQISLVMYISDGIMRLISVTYNHVRIAVLFLNTDFYPV